MMILDVTMVMPQDAFVLELHRHPHRSSFDSIATSLCIFLSRAPLHSKHPMVLAPPHEPAPRQHRRHARHLSR